MELKLRSKYNNYENHLQFLPCAKPSNSVFINIHGAFGESGDSGSKSQKLGELIASAGVANVMYVSTSRDWELYKKLPKKLQSEAFPNKTFIDEQNDIKDSIDYILHKSKEHFGVSTPTLFLVADSLGGTVIASLVGNYPQIKKLVLCNSGISSVSSDHCIFSTIISSDKIKESAATYKGSLLCLQGGMDVAVPNALQNELFESFKLATKTKILIAGANHNFSSLYGKDKELANKVYIDNIIDYLN